jgi:hypothetical protein
MNFVSNPRKLQIFMGSLITVSLAHDCFFLGFDVLTAMNVKNAIFGDATPYG